MPFEAKIAFVNQLKVKIGNFFTVSDTNLIMETISDILTRFDVTVLDEVIPGNDDLLDLYLKSVRVEGLSEKTIKRYRYIISRFLSLAKTHTRDITVYHLRSYLAKEKERGIADSTLEGNRQVFSAYFRWLHREGIIQNNPTANLGIIKCKKKIKIVYTDMDIEKLKRQCTNLRDRAIICFLLSTACRIGEMIRLNIDDLDLVNLECTVLGKGNKERSIYIDSVTGMLIQEYLNSRTDNNEALFVSLTGKHERLQIGGVQQMLRKLGKRANVEKVHAHKFRRTKATKLIKHGMAIQEVAEILGHEKLDTTMEYVVMDKSSVKNSYQKYA